MARNPVGNLPLCVQQRLPYMANGLTDQHIGLEEPDDGVWAI